ncbi:hypothetical protein SDC9_84697 [bioreactor metagenome]|uniref:Uncharacterized protein n=1 Tax=bioreactor metagenome TaxID=1076179 RepID=A0A644ZJY2_9ZZZZ
MGHFGIHVLPEFCWRARLHQNALRREFLRNAGVMHGGGDDFVQLLECGLGRAALDGHSPPESGNNGAIAQFLEGGHVGHQRRTGVAANRECAHLLAERQRCGGGHGVIHEIHLPADHVGQARHRSAIGRMRHGRLDGVREQRAKQMSTRAHTLRRIAHRIRLGLGRLDQIVKRLERAFVGHHQERRRFHQFRHRLQILAGIVGELGEEADVGGERGHVANEHGMPVGGLRLQEIHRDLRGASGAVIYHHRLLERGGHVGAQLARQLIGQAARRVRHDQGDRLAGEGGLCMRCGQGQQGGGQGRCGALQKETAWGLCLHGACLLVV